MQHLSNKWHIKLHSVGTKALFQTDVFVLCLVEATVSQNIQSTSNYTYFFTTDSQNDIANTFFLFAKINNILL